MPDDESQESTSGISFVPNGIWGAHAARVLVSAARRNKLQLRECRSFFATALFLNPRNMSGGKLPTAFALNECVGELHNSIERFAVRCSFHARFSENNCRVIAVKPR